MEAFARDNPKDPLKKAGTDGGRELFKRLSQISQGFSAEDVANAAANLLVNALRHAHAKRAVAEARFDEISGRTKQLLLDHYDGAGNRRSVFPYHQTISVPHFDFPKK